jgi:hypothetical protein
MENLLVSNLGGLEKFNESFSFRYLALFFLSSLSLSLALERVFDSSLWVARGWDLGVRIGWLREKEGHAC